MAEILFVRNVPLRKFYFRRVTRIWPTLFVFLLTITVFHRALMPSFDWKGLLASFTLTENYYSLFHRTEVLDHIWSLCIEEHIYIMLGLVAVAVRRWHHLRPLPILMVIALIMILNGVYLSAILHRDYYQVFWRTDVRGASILAGAIAYLLVVRGGLFRTRLVNVAPGLLLAAIALNVNPVPDCIKYSLGTALLALALVAFGTSDTPDRMKAILEWRPIRWLGVISYSVYLWQQPLIHLQGGHFRGGLLVLLALCLGTASYFFIEQPARRRLNTLLRPDA